MKLVLFVLIVSSALFCSAAEKAQESNTRIIMTDASGMPLADGFYRVTFRVYVSGTGNEILSEKTDTVESKNGICSFCSSVLDEFAGKGYDQVWISVQIEGQKETTDRTRVFLDTPE